MVSDSFTVGTSRNALRRRENWEQMTKNSGLGVLEDSQDVNVHSLTLDCCVLSPHNRCVEVSA